MKIKDRTLGKVSVTVEKDYHSLNKEYNKLTIVEEEGTFMTYISRKPVPLGTQLTDRNYWIPFSGVKESIVLDYNKFKSEFIEAEALRVLAENERKENESNRQQAESERDSAEDSRQYNEAIRREAETYRNDAESERIENENSRKTSEIVRQRNEGDRGTAETNRSRAESQRSINEQNRIAAEEAREQALLSYINDGKYNSQSKKIELLHDNTTIAQIDASDFLIDGMVDDVRIENGNLIIDFNTASGKQDISIPLTDIFNPANYYTKSEADDRVVNILNSAEFSDNNAGSAVQGTEAHYTYRLYWKGEYENFGTLRLLSATQEIAGLMSASDKTKLDNIDKDLEEGNLIPALAYNLEAWADQKAIATPDTYTDAVRTTGGDIPIETSAGSKLESIKPIAGSKWTAKVLFNGSYNMLNAAKWGAANSQPYVGGIGSDFVYFLVPKLTLGTFGTADENNGLLFTNSEGENVSPVVHFKPLGSDVPSSITDGTDIRPTVVQYDGNYYNVYETSEAGWMIIYKTIYDNDVCAHIAWEDWYDKYVSLDEPVTNPEAVVGTLMLESLLALAHSDKYLRGINEEVCDNIVFGDTSATISHMVDELSVAANAWTNSATGESDSQGNALYRHSTTVSGIKQGGAACVEGENGGIPLTVNGTTVSYVDTNVTAPASVVFYQIPTTEVVEKAYTDNVFSGSNIDIETGIMPINDCSIEAQVAMDGEAIITVKYAKNIVDQVAINATVDVPQIKEQVEEHEERITELEDTAVRTGSYDASVAVGLADNFKGDTIVDAEFYKRKTGGTQSVGSGIAAIKEVRGKSIVWNQLLQEGELVDMGLPSGTLWATCNIDITQPNGFAASPFQYECSFFSWGNVDGHNPISNSAFDYDWGGVNSKEPWYEGQVYGDTQGNTLATNIPVGDTYDAARVNVGSLWRMPTSSEFKELFANIRYINADGTPIDSAQTNKLVTVNGVVGLYLESTINGARLFFSCSGLGDGRMWFNCGSSGNYWSSTWSSARYARTLVFRSGGVSPQYSYYRFSGCALRPVISKSVIDNGKGGHKFAQYNNNISDLTLMFGAGNEPTTVAEFEKMFPLDYYEYNAGGVIPFAGQNLVTIGKNQYNSATGKANLLGGQTYQLLGTYTSATIDEVAVTLDSNDCFTTTKDCVLDVVGGNDTDTFVGLYNGETNTYEPYEKHTLPLDPSQWRDKQGNLVFPYGGMHGVGTAYDYVKVDADGYIRKAVRCFEKIGDLGSLRWTLAYNSYFESYESFSLAVKGTNTITKGYIALSSIISNTTTDKCVAFNSELKIRIKDSNYTDAASFKAAMQGVPLIYELAEPIEVELATPVYAKYLVDKDGTEEITPANGATPYTTPANLSILYAMDARGEIKNLPKNYLSKESAENMLNAMVSAGVIASYTMTYSNGQYVFTFVKAQEASTNQVNNESNI